MRSTSDIQEDGFGYNSTMLADYDSFIIIKPKFLRYADEIIKDLHRHDFIIIEAEEKTLTREEAETIYSCHRGKPFFDELVEYMTSGPCIGMILLSPFSDKNHATEVLLQIKSKYRKRYSIDETRNVMHCSDSYQSALHEAETFFNQH